MQERAALARAQPRKVLMVNVDGMDQAKTNVPNEVVHDKGGSAGLPLTVKLMAGIAYGRAWYGFWSIPQWSASSNITLTALSRIIHDTQQEGKDAGLPSPHLPPKLVLQMDNTAKDNKNHYLLGFAGLLLKEGLFEEVEAHFLPVGHTHQEIDQSFSLVSKALKEHGALDVPDLMKVASGAWTNLKYVGTRAKQNLLLTSVLDFRRAFRFQGGAGTTAGDEDGEVEPRNMHKFAGLGTQRRTEEDAVSKRCGCMLSVDRRGDRAARAHVCLSYGVSPARAGNTSQLASHQCAVGTGPS